MFILDANYFAILVVALLQMVIGWLWYSPMLFGKMWMRLSRMTEEQIEAGKKGMKGRYALTFIASLVSSYAIGMFIYMSSISTFGGALILVFWLWFGFVATILLSGVLWEGKPVKLYLLNIAHYLVSFGVSAVILALWR